MKFAPGMLRTKAGKKKFADLLGSTFDQGGNHVQFNISTAKPSSTPSSIPRTTATWWSVCRLQRLLGRAHPGG